MRSQRIPARSHARKPNPAPVESTLVSQAYQALRASITTGDLAPGSRIVERDLARRLGMSPTPVRAALHRLEQQGYLVTVTSGRTPRILVAPLRREDMEELFFLIGDLEGWAAFHCAAKPREQRVAVAARAAALNDALAAAPWSDLVRSHQLDADWHGTIIEAGAGPRMQGLLRTLKPQAYRYYRIYVASLGDSIALSVAEHQAVERAIRRGDGEAARTAMMANWIDGSHRLGPVIEARGELGSW